MRADNAKTVPSKAFRGERQYKLPGFRLGGPWSGIQPHSLEVFSNYSGTVRTSSVTVIQGRHCLDSSAHVPEFGAWEDGYEGVHVWGEQWRLSTEWGPEKQPGCLSVRASQESATHTRTGEKWAKNKSGIVAAAAAAADVLAVRQKLKCSSLPVFSSLIGDWLAFLTWEWKEKMMKGKKRHPKIVYIASSHPAESV